MTTASVYKFMHSQHLTHVLDEGTIKLGSLSHYRRLEGEQWIADRLEGSVELDPQGMVITEEDNQFDTMLPPSLVGRDVKASAGGRITFAPGVKVTIAHPEAYVFSASIGDLEQLTSLMCRKDQEGYDACIHITDIGLLAHRLFNRGVVLELKARVREVFQAVHCSRVSYEVLSRTAALGRAPEASPFLKDIHLADQSEIRIALLPPQHIEHSMLTIRVPRPGQLFKEVFRNRPNNT